MKQPIGHIYKTVLIDKNTQNLFCQNQKHAKYMHQHQLYPIKSYGSYYHCYGHPAADVTGTATEGKHAGKTWDDALEHVLGTIGEVQAGSPIRRTLLKKV